MARITHPRPQLGRTRPGVGGVVFLDGVAEVDLTDKPRLHAFYVQHGYSIEYDIDELTEDAKVNIPLSALTIAELTQVAADNDFTIPKGLRKPQVVEHVEQTLAHRKLMAEGTAAGIDAEDLDSLADAAAQLAASGDAPTDEA